MGSAFGGGLYAGQNVTIDSRTTFECNAIAIRSIDSDGYSFVAGGAIYIDTEVYPNTNYYDFKATFIGNTVGRLADGAASGAAIAPITARHPPINGKYNLVCGQDTESADCSSMTFAPGCPGWPFPIHLFKA